MATTSDYLDKLVEQRNDLATRLVDKGVEASTDETLETLIPKVSAIESGGGDTSIEDFLSNKTNEIINTSLTDYLRMYAFQNMAITKAEFINLQRIGKYAFNICNSLQTIKYPSVYEVGEYAFTGCTSLLEAPFPRLKIASGRMLQGCTKLKMFLSLDLEEIVAEYPFSGCSVLDTFIIGNKNKVCNLLATQAFGTTGTPIVNGTGYFYVPTSMYQQYLVATNWSAIHQYATDGTIRKIEDYPEILAIAESYGYESEAA